MKKIILITLCSIFSIPFSNAQTACECMDLQINIMTDILEGDGDLDIAKIEKKYAKQGEKCEDFYQNMSEEKAMSEMMACPRFNEMMELTMKLMENPELMEEMMKLE